MSSIQHQFYLDHVLAMRKAACLPLNSGTDADHALHVQLYAEELDEFLKGFAAADLREQADALGDVVVVAAGYYLDAGWAATKFSTSRAIQSAEMTAERLGINLPGAFLLIHESNMSKLCSKEQLEPTRQKYADLGLYVEFRPAGEGLWSPFAANTNGTIPKGKWLKGTGYHEPCWDKTAVWQL